MRLALFLVSTLGPVAARAHNANGVPHSHPSPPPMETSTFAAAPVELAPVALACFLVGILFVLACRHSAARAVLAFGGIGMSIACFAPVIPVPHSSGNGEPADAGQVNANFDEVVQQIANHADDAALQACIQPTHLSTGRIGPRSPGEHPLRSADREQIGACNRPLESGNLVLAL